MELLHHTAILVIVVGLICCSAYEMECPENSCICKIENGTNNTTDYISHCSNSSLTDFPRGLDPHTTVLNVSNNNITHIRNASDYEEGILHIDRVFAKSIHRNSEENGVLQSLSALRELHLESNLLAEIEPGALDGNPELLVLNLRDNNLTSLPVDVIRLNNKIHEIDISGNGIETIDMSSVERYFPELRKFDVSRNQLKHLISVSPQDGSVLEIFDASSNYLVDISDAFVNATKLKEVNVSNNELTYLNPDVFRDNPDLVSVDVSRNHLINIHKNVFSNQKQIIDIHAGSNKMTFIHPDTFSNNPDLTELTISWNNIEEIHPETFRNNPNLKSVNFRSNKIKHLNPNTFDNNPKLKSVDLRSNSLLTIERNTFLNNPQLEHVLLSKNQHIRFHDGFQIRSTVIKVFDVEHCNLTTLPAGILNGANNLRELNLANNNLTSLENITDGYTETMTKLEIIDLSNNNIQTINIDVFSNKLTNLKQLRIAGNSFLCNCTLRTLWLWSQKEGIVPAEPQIMCKQGMNSVPWDVLRDYNCSDEALMASNTSLPYYERVIDDMSSEESSGDVENITFSETELEDKNYSPDKAHPHEKTEYKTGKRFDHEEHFYDEVVGLVISEDDELDRSNKIMIGISLFILLAVALVILPLILILRKKKHGSFKVTKPVKQPFENNDVGADQKTGFTVSPAV